MIAGFLLGLTLTVVAVPDPGTSAAGAAVHVSPQHGSTGARRSGSTDARGRATLDVTPGAYEIDVVKTGFVPAHAAAVVETDRTIRVALHAVQSTALRTIGAVAAAQRGAFNASAEPLAVLPREGYRDQGQPGSVTVLAQTPSLTIDRAGRGLGAADDEPPVALVRGGTPLETQLLLDGVPIALPTTRTLALTALPAFVVNELEVHPGTSAPLPTIDGALNGTLNVRFPEPTVVWRALPEVGADGRGGSFADLAAGGGLARGRVGIALAATANGATSPVTPAFDTIQRALVLKARASLSPAATLTAATYDEGDANRFDRSAFSFTEGELRLDGARDTALARWWRASATRAGAAAGDADEFRSDDALTGASVEVDRAVRASTYALGLTETFGRGSALGRVDVDPGAWLRVQTAFARAIGALGPRVQGQLTLYGVRADATANGSTVAEGGVAARVGIVYRASRDASFRASVGSGFTPPSLVALAATRGASAGVTVANGVGAGFDRRVFDSETTLSFDVFSSSEQNRLVQDARGRWTNAGAVARRGAELSLARRPRAGLGYLLQAWTASETPAIARTVTDVASGATHGYTEISYHARQGSRVSLGATYWGADAPLAQPAVVMLNANAEIQIGARGKVQIDVENLNDAARAVAPRPFGVLAAPSAFAPGPRTVRLFLRRSIGRTGSDG